MPDQTVRITKMKILLVGSESVRYVRIECHRHVPGFTWDNRSQSITLYEISLGNAYDCKILIVDERRKI